MNNLRALLGLVVFLCNAPLLFSQSANEPIDEFLNTPVTEPFSAMRPSYGAILQSYDINNEQNNVLVLGARPWLRARSSRTSTFYIRGKFLHNRFLARQSGVSNETQNIYDLDQGFYQYRSKKIDFRLGRQFFRQGQGILIDSRADGLYGAYRMANYEVAIFGAYSGLLVKDDNPYNLSTRDNNDGARRLFSGATLSGEFGAHTPYLLYMNQADFAETSSASNTRYQSNYTGAGARGSLGFNLNYQLEALYAFGTSHSNGLSSTGQVSAYAGLARLTYSGRSSIKPRVFVELAYASGDPDRSSATSATGNSQGDDRGFIHFGSFERGLALRPRLSNLVAASMGLSILPGGGAQSRIFRDLQFLIKGSYYQKANSQGGINDGEATGNSRDLGFGTDIFLGWRLTSELSVVAAYGFFHPGAAFITGTANRHIGLMGASFSI